MRVIVTGSRDWEGISAVDLLEETLDHLNGLAACAGEHLLLVHGDCPSGADHYADEWAKGWPTMPEPERHPAKWEVFGNGAGPLRNEHMANLGADLCVAFLRNNSRGTINMIGHARRVGIYVLVVPWIGDVQPAPVTEMRAWLKKVGDDGIRAA